MKDENKTKAHLIKDLRSARRRIKRLEKQILEFGKYEEILRKSKERYKLLTGLTSDYIYRMKLNPQGHFNMEWISKSFLERFGYKRDNFNTSDQWRKFIVHPDDLEVLEKFSNEIIAGNQGEMDLRLVTKSGEVRWFNLSQKPLWDKKKRRVIGILGAGRDITRRKSFEEQLKNHQKQLEEVVEARTEQTRQVIEELKHKVEEHRITEEELRETTELLESVFYTTHILIAHMDTDFNFIRVNRAYAEAGGHPEEFYIGRNHFDLYPNKDNERIFRNVVETGNPYTVIAKPFKYAEYPERGVTFWDWTLYPLKDESGEVEALVLILLDVTERIRAEAAKNRAESELEDQRTRAIHADRLRSLGEMAAAIAHELNQPLQGVRGLAEHIAIGLSRGWKLTREDIMEKAKLAVEQADRMSHVIEHTRRFAREAGSLEHSPVNVNDVIESSLGMIGAQLRARGLVLERELASDLPMISANPYSLEEVILNLISNARDALSEAGRVFEPEGNIVKIRTYLEDDEGSRRVNIEVADHGIGIPPEIRDRIFEPFFTTKDSEKGTGLGLAIAKSIIDSFGGTISLDSSPGNGTTVTVSLPEVKQ